jgi:hypothetical protein
MIGLGTVTAQAADPQPPGPNRYYPVYLYQVCQQQGHFGDSLLNPRDPYSYYCYDLSFPLGITYAGGLDIQGWCQDKHPGSTATLYSDDVLNGWKCRVKIK